MKKNENNLKYLIRQNNYVGLLFFALVFASILYILKAEEIKLTSQIPTTDPIKEVNIPIPITICDKTNDFIEEYRKYLNPGTEATYKTYQTTYLPAGIKVENIDNESLLYMSYQYLTSNETYNKSRPLTCDEASIAGIQNEIIECGGTTYHLENYEINTAISRQLLKNTIQDIYNLNINNFPSFYTNGTNQCHYKNDEYLCITNSEIKPTNNNHGIAEFIRAYEYEDKIEIIEKYHYLREETSYKNITSDEVGEDTYISTFKKINGQYRYIKTELYN